MLSKVDVSGHVETKGRLKYLSWAWAWAELKKVCPEATSKVYEREDGRIYWDDGKTCWVKVSVTVADVECIEYLPIMDPRNNSVPLDKVTSMDANKAIQRGITKAIARHGLGLNVYAGEDLPVGEEPEEAAPENGEAPEEDTAPERVPIGETAAEALYLAAASLGKSRTWMEKASMIQFGAVPAELTQDEYRQIMATFKAAEEERQAKEEQSNE